MVSLSSHAIVGIYYMYMYYCIYIYIYIYELKICNPGILRDFLNAVCMYIYASHASKMHIDI